MEVPHRVRHGERCSSGNRLRPLCLNPSSEGLRTRRHCGPHLSPGKWRGHPLTMMMCQCSLIGTFGVMRPSDFRLNHLSCRLVLPWHVVGRRHVSGRRMIRAWDGKGRPTREATLARAMREIPTGPVLASNPCPQICVHPTGVIRGIKVARLSAICPKDRCLRRLFQR